MVLPCLCFSSVCVRAGDWPVLYFIIYYSVNIFFPSSLNVISPPSLQNEYMKDNFLIKIETWHKPDTGHLENVMN